VLASAVEMAAVQAFFHAELSLEYTWVDGSDALEEGVWRTSDGEVMTYLGWTGSEPNGGSNANCRNTRAGDVNDSACSDVFGACLCVM